MSEPTPEAHRPSGGKKENVFTRKLGPMPMWAWVAIVAGALILWAYYKNKQAGQQQQTPSGTNASQIPQFVNQTFTTVIPPTAPGPDVDTDKDKDKDHHKDVDPTHGPLWDDESKKDKRVKAWEHKHPGQEYPFNSWKGNPTKAQLAAFNKNPKYQPLPSQSDDFPMNMGMRPRPWQHGTPPPATGPVPGVEGTPAAA